MVHLKGYGLIEVFRIDTPDGAMEYRAMDALNMTPVERAIEAAKVWTISQPRNS